MSGNHPPLSQPQRPSHLAPSGGGATQSPAQLDGDNLSRRGSRTPAGCQTGLSRASPTGGSGAGHTRQGYPPHAPGGASDSWPGPARRGQRQHARSRAAQSHSGLGAPGSDPPTQATGKGQKQTAVQRRFQPVDQHSSQPTAKHLMNPGVMKTNERNYPEANGLFIRPAADAVSPIEPEDLSQLEGEGGQAAPLPTTELIDFYLRACRLGFERWVLCRCLKR